MLKINNLNTYYGAIHALKGVNIEVKKGEIVSLIGSNGAGKSTLVNTIAGLLKPKSGEILFEDVKIDNMDAFKIVRRGISLSPEGREVFPQLTVEENLKMGAYINSDKKNIANRFEQVYELFPKLKQRYSQLAATLSGGEQQMLAIGRAIMSRPEILILDEPSMGLAPLLVKEIFEIIKELNEKNGTTILLVEQNAKMALDIAHRGYVLETGKILKSGDAKELLNDDIVRKAYLGA